MRKYRWIVVLGIMAAVLLMPAAGVFAADIQELIDLYISDSEAAIPQLMMLMDTEPETVTLVLAGVAEYVENLDPADAERQRLLGCVTQCCCDAAKISPALAGQIVATMQLVAPDIATYVEATLIAEGLEEKYLTEASPVAPK